MQTEADYLVLEAKSVGVLQTCLGESIIINHPVGYLLQTLVQRGLVDCVIVDTEDGFSQLGMMRHFLSKELGLKERNLVKWVLDGFSEDMEKNISSLADWNRSRTPEVTLVAIPSERPSSRLKGLILSPYEGSECYKKYSAPEYFMTHRDFMYNVTYEAISYAYKIWGARRIGITHFSRSKYGLSSCSKHGVWRPINQEKYRRDLTTCQIEAMTHFCNVHKGMECFTFLDDSKGNHPLEIVKEFNEIQDIGVHRTINTKTIKFLGIDFVDLDWTTAPEDVISG